VTVPSNAKEDQQMPNAFISYSSKDEELAMQLHGVLKIAGIDTFIAAISIAPGANWTEAIFENLNKILNPL